MKNYKIKCPCHRGYLSILWVNDEGIPIAFSINKGYLLISGYCDSCKAQIAFTVTLADLLTEESPNWTSAVTKKV